MKNVGKCVAFALILLLLLNLITISFFPIDSFKRFGILNSYRYEVVSEEDDLVDVLVLGDSLVYSSYSPMEAWNSCGITSFDCAEPAQVIQGAYKYLKVAIEKEHPKLVVMEPNVVFRDIKKRKLTNMIWTALPEFFPISRYHDMWKKYGFEREKAIESVNKGYTSISKSVPLRKWKKNPALQAKRWETIPEGNLDYLEKIMQLCDDYGAKLIFVSFPTRTSWYAAKHNSTEKIAKQYGIEFVDLNEKNLGIDWKKETRDGGHHLNNAGAKKVSVYLAEYLTEKENLPDHRHDAKYEKWRIAYEKYERNLKKS